ncbi:MAG: TIGR02147 family protein [Myxococcales bacterium]|nr:MAG: TIGR02147 family protein [Myxococcales bacterium]
MPKLKLTISVYDYNDFQAFLQDAYADLNRQDGKFSYRFLQRLAGYSARSNHFWQVAKGKAKLSAEAAARYARALGLTPRQTQYFSLLAAMKQAKRDTDRAACVEQLRSLRPPTLRKNEALVRYEFYSDWYLPALRELVALPAFKEDPEWIAKTLIPSISPRQAKEGVEKLVALGFLVRDGKGRLKQAEPMIGGYGDRLDRDPVAKLAVRSFHRRMIELGEKSIEAHPQEDRLVVGATVAISQRQAQALRERVREFMQELDAIVAEDEPIETVCRLNVQLFPFVRRAADVERDDGDERRSRARRGVRS